MFQPDGITNADISQIRDDDILCLSEDGTISVVWETESSQNAFFLTEACDCRCLMCPQPPKLHDPKTFAEAERILSLLAGRRLETICITGGEPTLLGDGFLSFLRRCGTEHPEAQINVLTNGKRFADIDFAKAVSEVASPKTFFCVSLHGDIPSLHDRIVGSAGSFEATEEGIYNMARWGLKIEMRHVVTRLNFSRLPHFARHVYDYFPFCSHYAIMAMEIHGCAVVNMDEIGIDPSGYRRELAEAVLEMDRRGLPVSIYNVPLCLCDEKIRCFARQSISAWKNIYLPQCKECSQREKCAGFFSTSSVLPVEHIHPITEGGEKV